MSKQEPLSANRLNVFLTCPRKYQLSYIFGLEEDKDKPSRRIGTVIHEALDGIAKGDSIHSVQTDIRFFYASQAGDSFWLAVERETVCQLIEGYAEYHAGENPILCSERQFDIPLIHPDSGELSPDYRLAGRIDKIIKGAQGLDYVREHKSTSEKELGPTAAYWNRLNIDLQTGLYIVAARSMGFETIGVEYDVIRKPMIYPRKFPGSLAKKTVAAIKASGVYYGWQFAPEEIERAIREDRETAFMFGARLADDIRTYPEWYYHRKPISRLDDELAEMLRDVWQISEAITYAKNRCLFYKNTANCLRPYKCDFCNLCFSNSSIDAIRAGNVPNGYRMKQKPETEPNGESTADPDEIGA